MVLYNQSLITKYQYASNYLGVPVERTDDWCFEVKQGRITHLGIGGQNSYHMFGVSYWSERGRRRSWPRDIKQVYEMPGRKGTVLGPGSAGISSEGLPGNRRDPVRLKIS